MPSIFDAACFPDIFSAPEKHRRAGIIIRRRIQRLYADWYHAERYSVCPGQGVRYDYDKWTNQIDPPMKSFSEQPWGARRALEALEKHRELSDAYHAWSRSSSIGREFTADDGKILAAAIRSEAALRYRERRKAAGDPVKHSGPSGGQTTAAERKRRQREREKAKANQSAPAT